MEPTDRACRGRSDQEEGAGSAPVGCEGPNRSVGSSPSGRIEEVMKPGAPGVGQGSAGGPAVRWQQAACHSLG
ncbi:hypothetical protein GCM10010472_50330 [Pseudonocardia halophobica]